MKALDTRKSAATKRMLADSLKRLILQKPFGQITVNDVIAGCGVNRKTFYYHFEDLRGLLRWMLEQEAAQLVLGCGRSLPTVLDYAQEHREMLRGICGSAGRDELERFFSLALAPTVASVVTGAGGKETPEELREFLCRFYTCAVAGTLTDWVSGDEGREQVSRLLDWSLHTAVPQALQTVLKT